MICTNFFLFLVLQQASQNQQDLDSMKPSGEHPKRKASSAAAGQRTSLRIEKSAKKEKPKSYSEEFLPKRRRKPISKNAMAQLRAASTGASNVISEATSTATSTLKAISKASSPPPSTAISSRTPIWNRPKPGTGVYVCWLCSSC